MEENNFQEEQENNERRKKLYLLGPLMLLVALGGVSFAIFNYTRTGTANVIKVGKLSFNSNQTETINLVNVFPIDRSDVGTDLTNVDEALITITGDTTYDDGIEYLVTATDFSNTVGTGNNTKTVPISISVTASNGLGTSDEDYYTNRGGNSSIYKVLSGTELTSDEQILVGYITKGQTGVNGSLTIKAFLDKDKIGISDTYDGTESDSMGTTNEWANGRIILTTTEWNALQTNGISFKIKVEANEGTWVSAPLATTIVSNVNGLEDVAGAKRYVGANPNNYVIFNNEEWRIIGIYGDKLKIVKAQPLADTYYYNATSIENLAWETSDVESFLENTYYSTLSQSSKSMIYENASWNVGGVDNYDLPNLVYTSSQASTWVGKVGLVSAYEYLYACENDGTCRNVPGPGLNASGCAAKNWLYPMLSSYSWLMEPNENYYYGTAVDSTGSIISGVVNNYYKIFPVIYLKAEVTITGGTGEYGGNEYVLAYSVS